MSPNSVRMFLIQWEDGTGQFGLTGREVKRIVAEKGCHQADLVASEYSADGELIARHYRRDHKGLSIVSADGRLVGSIARYQEVKDKS